MDDKQVQQLIDAITKSNSNASMTKNLGGADELMKSNTLLAQGVNKLTAGFSALAGGTATATDLINASATAVSYLGPAGSIAGKAFSELGLGVVNVNNTLKETGKYGITFGQNLGEANLAIKGAQLTMPEFASLVQASGKSLAGLSGGQNASAKAFLSLSTELQQTKAAQELKAAGMSSLELNEAMLTVARTSGPVNMTDINSKRQMIAASIQVADEMNKVADLTGKSRKQQEAEIAAIQARADVQAATLAQMRIDPEFGNRLTTASVGMGKFGTTITELLAEESTEAGARSESALNTKAALGDAGIAIQEYGRAIKSGNAIEIERTKARAEELVAARLANADYNKTVSVTQGNLYNMGKITNETYDVTKNIMSKQAEVLRNTGKNISEYEAMTMLEKEGKLRTKGLKADGTVDEGAILGRSLNQVENLGKVAGTVIAEGFNVLNTKLGKTVNEAIPDLNNKFKELSTTIGLKTAGKEGAKVAIDTAATTLGANPAKRTEGTSSKVSKPIDSNEFGSKDSYGDWFGKDFGSGTLSWLHDREAIVPRKKMTEFFSDMMGQIKPPASLQQPQFEQPAMPDVSSNMSAGSDSIMKEMVGLLQQLNIQMGQMITHTADVADLTGKQVQATHGLSNNRFAV